MIQAGIGVVPDAALLALSGHKGLGVHTEMFSDGRMASGVITIQHERVHRGKTVTAFAVGSQALLNFVDDNPEVLLDFVDDNPEKQLIDTIGTIAVRGHAQLLLERLSALAPIAAQRGNTTNSNQQIISLNALARAHYRRSIGTRGGAQASAAD
ncbi:hypothetical protein T492DRAFT_863955 [Pavlovales sp. CCMP2436]|nr:hypothetical protein T492DRAFT_863955 [Pavlovales sp. CCMP2436]